MIEGDGVGGLSGIRKILSASLLIQVRFSPFNIFNPVYYFLSMKFIAVILISFLSGIATADDLTIENAWALPLLPLL